jgi:hypothetical protein
MVAPAARGLVLIAHCSEASRRQAGHGFVADVLHANGFATLPFSLHTPQDTAAGLAPPGMVQSRQRLRGLLDWVLGQPSLGDRPLALIGVGDASAVCVAVAARCRRTELHCLVLLDAKADKLAHHLVHLSLPALFVLGQCDARRLARQRVALRDILAGHRLEMLSQPTLPQPAAGALEAFACAALEWLDRSLAHRSRAAGGAGGPSSHTGTGRGDPARGPTDRSQSTARA